MPGTQERIHHVLGPIRGGKYAAAALDLVLDAELGQQGQDVVGKELREGRAQEASVLAELPHELGDVGGVGDVAATLAGNAQLAPGPEHLFQQDHVSAQLGGSARGQ